jgi:small conductance mechanosensitive channel
MYGLAIGFSGQSWQEVLIRVGIIAAAAVIGLYLLRRAIDSVVRTAMRRGLVTEDEELQRRIETLADVIFRTVLVVILIVAGLTVLSQAGFDIGPILAAAGVAGLAIGLGAQTLIRDALNGLFILLENQFARGDVITVAGVSGLVEDVSLRRTLVRDRDGTLHSIPNSQIAVASNHTRQWSRVHLNVSVAIDADATQVMQVIDRVGQELADDALYGPMILAAPRAVWVDGWSAGALLVKILGDTKPGAQWEVAGELRKRLQAALKDAKIQPV